MLSWPFLILCTRQKFFIASPLATLGSQFLIHGSKKPWQLVLSGAEGSHSFTLKSLFSFFEQPIQTHEKNINAPNSTQHPTFVKNKKHGGTSTK